MNWDGEGHIREVPMGQHNLDQLQLKMLNGIVMYSTTQMAVSCVMRVGTAHQNAITDTGSR